MVEDAINDLLEQNKVFFQREIEQLTEHQMNFLIALANGVTTGFSRKEVINKYRLESSANIQSIKKSLIKKDLIDVDGQTVNFDDSLFKLWIKRQNMIWKGHNWASLEAGLGEELEAEVVVGGLLFYFDKNHNILWISFADSILLSIFAAKSQYIVKMDAKQIGNIIKERRKQLDVNQQTLSDLAGVGLNTLVAIERGEGNPQLSTLLTILDTLGLQIDINLKTLDYETV